MSCARVLQSPSAVLRRKSGFSIHSDAVRYISSELGAEFEVRVLDFFSRFSLALKPKVGEERAESSWLPVHIRAATVMLLAPCPNTFPCQSFLATAMHLKRPSSGAKLWKKVLFYQLIMCCTYYILDVVPPYSHKSLLPGSHVCRAL